MVYREYIFTLSGAEEYYKDLMINSLAGIGFSTFEDQDGGFSAYIPVNELNTEDLDAIVRDFRRAVNLSYEFQDIPQQNWNEVWESNFEPVLINETCYIRASFHEPRPD